MLEDDTPQMTVEKNVATNDFRLLEDDALQMTEGKKIPDQEMINSTTFSLAALAGELRGIQSKDEALKRRILVEARSMEDKYFAEVELRKNKQKDVTMDVLEEARQLHLMVDQFMLEEEEEEEEDVLNEVMDHLMEDEKLEAV